MMNVKVKGWGAKSDHDVGHLELSGISGKIEELNKSNMSNLGCKWKGNSYLGPVLIP